MFQGQELLLLLGWVLAGVWQVPEHGGVMKVPGSEAPFPLLLRKGLGCRDVPDLWLFVAEDLK